MQYSISGCPTGEVYPRPYRGGDSLNSCQLVRLLVWAPISLRLSQIDQTVAKPPAFINFYFLLKLEFSR
jgi:hypothetical protein